jgi:hypothetical protein
MSGRRGCLRAFSVATVSCRMIRSPAHVGRQLLQNPRRLPLMTARPEATTAGDQ